MNGNRNSGAAERRLKWEMACRRLEKKIPDSIMKRWVAHLELKEIGEEKATVVYRGDGDLARFLEEYGDILSESLCWALRRSVTVEFENEPSADRGRLPRRTRTPRRSASQSAQAPQSAYASQGAHTSQSTHTLQDAHTSQRTHTSQKKPRIDLKRGCIYVFACAVCLFVISAVLIVGMNIYKNRMFKENFYQLSSGKVDSTLRIVQLSDLHDSSYGKENEKLISRIEKLDPDIILMSGDMINQGNDSSEKLIALCSRLTETAPVYYIYGNNENTREFGIHMELDKIDSYLGVTEENRDVSGFLEKTDTLRAELEAAGVHVLWNEYDTVEVNGTTVDIYGVLTSNSSAFWPYAEKSFDPYINSNKENLKIMVSHEPYIFEDLHMDPVWSDLAFCGHTHGGVIRIPKYGALYERKNGFLPERKAKVYIAGKYGLNGMPLIVNRGLTKKGPVRINNRPEIVIVDINRY